MQVKTKFCGKCNENLSLDKFSVSASKKDGLQTYCTEHMKEYRKAHYHNNKEKYAANKARLKLKIKMFVLEIKNNTPCVDCGIIYENEPWLTEFDHLSDKLDTISKLMAYGSFQKLKTEILKCELVCLICHRRRSAKRGKWWGKNWWSSFDDGYEYVVPLKDNKIYRS